MPATKYRVALSEQQRQQLERVVNSDTNSVRERTRACILLLADTNREGGACGDTAICQAVGVLLRSVSVRTFHWVCRRFCKIGEHGGTPHKVGVEAVLRHEEQPNRKAPELEGATAAHLFALAGTVPPLGHRR